MIPTLVLLSGWGCAPTERTEWETASETGIFIDSGELTAPDGCFSSPASVEIGTGENTWELLLEGAPLTMIHGPQGGWHVLLSARAQDSDRLAQFHLQVQTDLGVSLADNTYQVGLIAESDCSGYYPGMYAYLDVSALAEGELNTPPELLAGEVLQLTLALEDESGRTAIDQKQVIARADPADLD